MNGLGKKDGTWKGALASVASSGEGSLGSRSQLLECLQCPCCLKAGVVAAEMQGLCNQDTRGDEEPHSGTTEAGQLYLHLNIKH